MGKKPAGVSPKREQKDGNDTDSVDAFLAKLHHPLQAEIEAVRYIIKNADKKLGERIKWNAPSFFYREDLVTFNPRTPKYVHLVFHHPSVVKIKSPILKGDYKDRRMVYLHDMYEVELHRKELERIMQELVKQIEKQ